MDKFNTLTTVRTHLMTEAAPTLNLVPNSLKKTKFH